MTWRVLNTIVVGASMSLAVRVNDLTSSEFIAVDLKHVAKSASSLPAIPFRSNKTAELMHPTTSKHSSNGFEHAAAPASFSEFVMSMPDKYSRIAYDVEYHSVREQLMTLPMRRPRTFNLMMATSKTWLADMLVQMAEGRAKGSSHSVDWRRSAAFAVFGFFYVGLVQWALYVSVMTQICPNAISFSNQPWSEKLHNVPGQVDLAKQVVLDNFFFAVLIYFPVFYVVKELLNGSRSPVADALRRYRGNFVSDNLASMAFWIPGDFLAFAAPIYLRLPIDHSVSFIWTMVLSYKRGAAAPPAEKPCSKEPATN